MTNLFNQSIKSYVPGTSYAHKDKVIYNFEVYYSLIANNTLLPSTGNIEIDSYMSQTLNIIVGNTWSRL